MSSIIQQIIKQAYATFSKSTVAASSQLTLINLLNRLKAVDIGFEDALDAFLNRPYRAPAGYMPILECQYFNICVFILQNKRSIPLHDHPGMTGLIKVIHGSIKVSSFDGVTTHNNSNNHGFTGTSDLLLEPIECIFNGDMVVTKDDETQTLYHDKRNYHSIEAISGPAAFIDILAPPYDDTEGRDCHYYVLADDVRTEADVSKSDRRICYLRKVPPPLDFYCNTVLYQGPPINDDYRSGAAYTHES